MRHVIWFALLCLFATTAHAQRYIVEAIDADRAPQGVCSTAGTDCQLDTACPMGETCVMDECRPESQKIKKIVGSSTEFHCDDTQDPARWIQILNTASPGGSDTEVQFNEGGTLAGTDSIVLNDTTKAVKFRSSPWYDVTHEAYGATGDAGECSSSASVEACDYTTACGQWYCDDDADRLPSAGDVTPCSCIAAEWDGLCAQANVTGDACAGTGYFNGSTYEAGCWQQACETDDATAIQAAVDAAYAAGGGELRLPNIGTPYLVDSVTWKPGVSMRGLDGAEIAQTANARKWSRMITTDATASGEFYGSSTDYDPIAFYDLKLDGNQLNRGTYNNYEQEQSSLFYLSADSATAGRIVVTMENIDISDPPGDGIHMRSNVFARLTGITCDNCFRGGITSSGGYSVLFLNDYTATGDRHPGGFNLEPDTTGFGGTERLDIFGSNIDLAGGLDLSAYDGASVSFSKFISRGQVGDGTGASATMAIDVDAESTVQISLFDITGGRDSWATAGRINRPGLLTQFSNGIFRLQEPTPDTDNDYAALRTNWDAAAGPQTLRIVGSKFVVDSGATPSDTKYGMWSNSDITSEGNRLELFDVTFSDDFDHAYYINGGATHYLRDVTCFSDNCIYVSAANSEPANVTVEGGLYEPATTYMDFLTTVQPHVVEHRSVTVDGDNFNTMLRTTLIEDNSTFNGGRIVNFTSSAPTAPCLPGDTGKYSGDTYSCTDHDVWVRIGDTSGVQFRGGGKTQISEVGTTRLRFGDDVVSVSGGKFYARLTWTSGLSAINWVELTCVGNGCTPGTDDLSVNFSSVAHVPATYDGHDTGVAYSAVTGWGWGASGNPTSADRDGYLGLTNKWTGFKYTNAATRTWEADVEDGEYTVSIGAGDIRYDQTGVHTIDVSGDGANWITVISYTDSIGSNARLHDGSSGVAVLSDSGEAYTTDEFVGRLLYNVDDDSTCTVLSNTGTDITCVGSLAGGTDNDWDLNDNYAILQVEVVDKTKAECISRDADGLYLFHDLDCDGVQDAGEGELGQGDTLAALSCSSDELAQWDGAAWVCALVSGGGAPTDATYWTSTADAGLSAEVVVDDLAALNTALGTSIADGAHTVGPYALGADTTGNYVDDATANGGLTLTGTEGATLGMRTDCANDEVLKWNLGTSWICAPDAYDLDTNANTLCTGSTYYLDGDGNCDNLIGALDHIATSTICAVGEYIDGAGACSSGVGLDHSTSITVDDGFGDADWSLTVDQATGTDPNLLYDYSEIAWSQNFPLDLRPGRSQMISKWEQDEPGTWGGGDSVVLGSQEALPAIVLPWRGGVATTNKADDETYNIIGTMRNTNIASASSCDGVGGPGNLVATGDSDNGLGTGECEEIIIGDEEFNGIKVLFTQGTGNGAGYRLPGLDLIGKNIIDISDMGNTAATYNTRLVNWTGANQEDQQKVGSVWGDQWIGLATGGTTNVDAGAQSCEEHASSNIAIRECFARNRLVIETGDAVAPIQITESTLEAGRGDGVQMPEGIWGGGKFILSPDGSTNECSDPGFDTTNDFNDGDCTGPTASAPGAGACVYNWDTNEDHGWSGDSGTSLRIHWDEDDTGGGAYIQKCDNTKTPSVAIGDWIHCRMFLKVTEDLSHSEIDIRLRQVTTERTYYYNGGLDRHVPMLQPGEWHEALLSAQATVATDNWNIYFNKSGSGTDSEVEMFIDDVQCVVNRDHGAETTLEGLTATDNGMTPFFPAEGTGPFTLDPGMYLSSDMKAEVFAPDGGYGNTIQVTNGFMPPMLSGRWYGPDRGGNFAGTADAAEVVSTTATTDNIHIYPFYVDRTTSFDSARVRVKTAESGKLVQVGVYTWDYNGYGINASSGCGGTGSTLVATFPTGSTTTATDVLMDVSPYTAPYNVLDPGWYCVAMFTNATGTAAVRRKHEPSGGLFLGFNPLGSDNDGFTNSAGHWEGDVSYSGTLPSDLSGVTNLSIETAHFPSFYIRAK